MFTVLKTKTFHPSPSLLSTPLVAQESKHRKVVEISVERFYCKTRAGQHIVALDWDTPVPPPVKLSGPASLNDLVPFCLPLRNKPKYKHIPEVVIDSPRDDTNQITYEDAVTENNIQDDNSQEEKVTVNNEIPIQIEKIPKYVEISNAGEQLETTENGEIPEGKFTEGNAEITEKENDKEKVEINENDEMSDSIGVQENYENDEEQKAEDKVEIIKHAKVHEVKEQVERVEIPERNKSSDQNTSKNKQDLKVTELSQQKSRQVHQATGWNSVVKQKIVDTPTGWVLVSV